MPHLKKALVLVSLFGIAIFLWRQGATADTYEAQSPSYAALRTSPHKEDTGSPKRTQLLAQSKPVGESTDPAVVWRGMDEKFRAAQSLRAFYYYAIKNPKEGGYFYAMHAMSTCARLNTEKVTGQAGAAQSAAANLRMRCDFSEQDIEDGSRELAAIRELNFKDDPLLRLMFTSVAARSETETVAAFSAAAQSGNPNLIGGLAMPYLASVLKSPGESQTKANEDVRFALNLLACRLGADCSNNSVRALSLCAERGWCESNVQDSLKKGLGSQYERLDGVSKDVAAKVKNGAIAGLVVPEK